MGDVDVDTFLERLKELITSSKLYLITREKQQLVSLEEEIKYLRGFLKVTEKKRNEHSEIMELVKKIRDVLLVSENIVELFVIDAFEADASYSLPQGRKRRGEWFNDQDFLSLDLEGVKKEMKTLMAEVKKIYEENMYDINGEAEAIKKLMKHSSTGIGSGGGLRSSGGSNTSKVVKDMVVVGFKEEVERLLEKLDNYKGGGLEIVTIIGAGGGGKTTLAREVYNHPFTSYKFEVRAWVDVSQDYDKTIMKRDFLISILQSASLEKPDNYEKMSEDKLGEELLNCLKGKRYLIVMDDVWSIEAWNDIRRSFPNECKGSKVLFTSRLDMDKVVQRDSVHYTPHRLAPLPHSSSWELLQKKVFGGEPCPQELEEIGEQIAGKCGGLPLAIVAIAGILAIEDKTLKLWMEVAEHLSLIIEKKNQEGCMEVLELSYNHLPLHLKACFLYIGASPEDCEIPVRELIWLWIAEGFIQQSEGGKSLEAIAEDYLIDLIDRSLVMVARKRSLGEIKACRIHDLLRVLCSKKAEEDNFFVQLYGDDSLSDCATSNRRRLFIGYGPKYQSLDDYFWPQYRDLHSIVCPGLLTPYLLRDLSSRRFLDKLNMFLNLETLNVRAPAYYYGAPSSYEIPLPRDIFKVRHLYSDRGVFHLHKFSNLSYEERAKICFDHSSKLDSLQTLHQICACNNCRSILERTPNLRKLGFSGKLISHAGVLILPDVELLNCLDTLSFKFTRSYESKRVPNTFPAGLKFPSSVTRLTLQRTVLKWEELSLLQTLPSLEVLKLLDDACCGPVWDTSELEEGFSQLKYLCLKFLDIKKWEASRDQFPLLEVLVVGKCPNLEQIPMDFANLTELRELEVWRMNRSVEESARKIQDERKNKNGDDDCLNLLFKENRPATTIYVDEIDNGHLFYN